jgi:type IV pilus assembly protein PilY1
MVFFGTGKYLESSDNSSTGTQSFYGIRDYNNSTVLRTNLVQQTVLSVATTTAGNVRTTSSNPVNYAGTDKGWYINLPTSKERTTGQPKLDSGTVWFNTFIPSTSPCEGGGTGWLMSMNYLDGKMPTSQLYDTNNDSAINSSDTLVSGFQVGAALGGTTLITNANVNSPGIGVSSLTNSALSTILLNLGGSGSRGRVNWREIIQ